MVEVIDFYIVYSLSNSCPLYRMSSGKSEESVGYWSILPIYPFFLNI